MENELSLSGIAAPVHLESFDPCLCSSTHDRSVGDAELAKVVNRLEESEESIINSKIVSSALGIKGRCHFPCFSRLATLARRPLPCLGLPRQKEEELNETKICCLSTLSLDLVGRRRVEPENRSDAPHYFLFFLFLL